MRDICLHMQVCERQLYKEQVRDLLRRQVILQNNNWSVIHRGGPMLYQRWEGGCLNFEKRCLCYMHMKCTYTECSCKL